MTEHRRTDVFKLCHWRRFLGVLLTARRSNQSILKEIKPVYSLEGLMLTLKLQYFSHLMWRTASFEKTLIAGKDWRQEEKGTIEDEMVGWHLWLDGSEFEQAPRAADGQGKLACCSPWDHKESDTTEWLNWMKTVVCLFNILNKSWGKEWENVIIPSTKHLGGKSS